MQHYTDEEIRTAVQVREIVEALREQEARLGTRSTATGKGGGGGNVVPISRAAK